MTEARVASAVRHARIKIGTAGWSVPLRCREAFAATGPSAILDRFIEEVAGLGRKLAVLLVQLPPSLAFASRAARGFFSVLTAALPRPVSIACEPRHASWSSQRADELLRQFGISRVAADPARWQHDAAPGGDPHLAYFRLHGSPRVYFSNYEEERLEQLRQQLLQATRLSQSVWCIFDNTAHSHATGNALWMQRRIASRRRG